MTVMALTTDQLEWLHSEVGQSVTDETLNEKYDRLASVRDVAIECLRERRAQLLEHPKQVTVDGVASITYAENIKALERRLTALTQLDDDPSDDPGDEQDGGTGVEPVRMVQLRRTRGR
jgi:hypothetical protein